MKKSSIPSEIFELFNKKLTANSFPKLILNRNNIYGPNEKNGWILSAKSCGKLLGTNV